MPKLSRGVVNNDRYAKFNNDFLPYRTKIPSIRKNCGLTVIILWGSLKTRLIKEKRFLEMPLFYFFKTAEIKLKILSLFQFNFCT